VTGRDLIVKCRAGKTAGFVLGKDKTMGTDPGPVRFVRVERRTFFRCPVCGLPGGSRRKTAIVLVDTNNAEVVVGKDCAENLAENGRLRCPCDRLLSRNEVVPLLMRSQWGQQPTSSSAARA
jgi:hypothetical protein